MTIDVFNAGTSGMGRLYGTMRWLWQRQIGSPTSLGYDRVYNDVAAMW